jgi:hypothetical protein
MLMPFTCRVSLITPVQLATVAVILAQIVIGACASPVAPPVSAGYHVAASCAAKDQANYYFPEDSIADRVPTDHWLRAEYAKILNLIDAPPLWCDSKFTEAYRLILLPPFDAPLVVTLTTDGRGSIASVATYSGPLNTIASNSFVNVSAAVSQQPVPAKSLLALQEALEKAEYWSTPVFRDLGTADGTAWTIEARRNGSYRVVTRLSGRDEKFEEAARILVTMSGVDLPSAMRKSNASPRM